MWGRLVDQPELRTTPGGMALLRLAIDCGLGGEELQLEVVMAGEGVREVAPRLKTGQEVYITGRLRAVGRAGKSRLRARPIEVLATEIKPTAS